MVSSYFQSNSAALIWFPAVVYMAKVMAGYTLDLSFSHNVQLHFSTEKVVTKELLPKL